MGSSRTGRSHSNDRPGEGREVVQAIVELDKLSEEATRSIVNMENAKRVGETLNRELNLGDRK